VRDLKVNLQRVWPSHLASLSCAFFGLKYRDVVGERRFRNELDLLICKL
jgi:hypothetical protein